MIQGVGIDIIEIDRVEKMLNRQPKMVERILTEREQSLFLRLKGKRRKEFFAGRFAAKEAFAKARGTGIGKNLSFQDIEVLSDELGKPYIVSNKKDENIFLSISHSAEYAVAQVIIERM